MKEGRKDKRARGMVEGEGKRLKGNKIIFPYRSGLFFVGWFVCLSQKWDETESVGTATSNGPATPVPAGTALLEKLTVA